MAALVRGGPGPLPVARALLAPALALVVLLAGACGPAPAMGARALVQPGPGAVLTPAASPAAATVHLAGPVPAGATLTVLDASGDDVGTGDATANADTLRRALPGLPPGPYTLLWQAGTVAGSSTFWVWAGGPLPPSLAAAAGGGPTQHALGWWGGLLAALALVEGLTCAGATAVVAVGARPRALRVAGLGLALFATAFAAEHSAAAAGMGVAALVQGPFLLPLLRGTVASRALGAAACGIAVGLLAPGGRQQPLPGLPGARDRGLPAAVAGVLGLALVAGAIPAIAARGLLVWALAAGGLVGLGLYAGPWPHLLRGRTGASGPVRLLGLVLAAACGLPLDRLLHPVPSAPVVAAVLLVAVAMALGSPASRRRGPGATAMGLGLAAAALLALPLAGPGPALAPAATGAPAAWAYQETASGIGIAVNPLQPGINTIAISDPGAGGPVLRIEATDTARTGIGTAAVLRRVGPGQYAGMTDILSVRGPWQLAVGGQHFALAVGPDVAQATCAAGFAGLSAAVAAPGGPVGAVASDPGDGNDALAATDQAIFATSDGGHHWRPAGKLAGVATLGIGRYGQWYAGTPTGLWTSTDGGADWSALTTAGPSDALALTLYPAVAAWATVGNRLYSQQTALVSGQVVPVWGPVGAAPAGVRAILPVPSASPEGTATLIAATGNGLATSLDGGGRWTAASGVTTAVTALAASGDGFWAAGPSGLLRATGSGGPWSAVATGGSGRPPTSVATGGAAGGDVFAAAAGVGLLESSDGGTTWRQLGCASERILALAGTYALDAPAAAVGTPLVYVGDAGGNIAALFASGD